MMPRLSWSIEKTRLILTVTDGPKTSHYTLTRSGSAVAQRATLRAVLVDLGGAVAPEPIRPAYVAPVAIPEELAGLRLEGTIRTDGPMKIDHPNKFQVAPENFPDSSNQMTTLSTSEEESLEAFKERAWKMAQQNAQFWQGELSDDATTRLLKSPAHSKLGVNPGFPELNSSGYQAVDGSMVSTEAIREKPQFNTDNHED